MEMIEHIKTAEKKARMQKELAKILGISSGYIRMVKAKKRSFSVDVCIKLADYIEADRLEIIAANGLVTEKNEEKRKIYLSCSVENRTKNIIDQLDEETKARILEDHENQKYRRKSDKFLSSFFYQFIQLFQQRIKDSKPFSNMDRAGTNS